ncbi:MAG: hypothetical protein UV38_C0002G0071 [candidate division TM6 bacterium GW2011_GWE2_42_60]|nr:MAG: hypothetical protein UV38_C0002G0071 [candidate division TM6 bacterium GW2011_GWE2_42_60]HBY06172.1 hypothetical protein [Candidatus Dependentiae bacterium]
MKKLVFAAGMLVIVLLAVPLVQAGFWETEVFVKNSTKDIWMNQNPKTKEIISTIKPGVGHTSVYHISRKGIFGDDTNQEYRAVFTSTDKKYPEILCVVQFKSGVGLRFMVRDVKRTETDADWISIPAGNGSHTFQLAAGLYVKVSYWLQALLHDVEFTIKNSPE